MFPFRKSEHRDPLDDFPGVRFSQEAVGLFNQSISLAHELDHEWLGSEHLLLAFLHNDSKVSNALRDTLDLRPKRFADVLIAHYGMQPVMSTRPRLKRTLEHVHSIEHGVSIAGREELERVEIRHLALGILRADSAALTILTESDHAMQKRIDVLIGRLLGNNEP